MSSSSLRICNELILPEDIVVTTNIKYHRENRLKFSSSSSLRICNELILPEDIVETTNIKIIIERTKI